MERAAIYVRVSTDADAQKDSPLNQIATCQEYAQTIGMRTFDALIYNDAGISGTEMANRPEVQRMLADARTGKFDAILFTAISRFSRDLSDAFSTKKRLEAVYGIRLISIEEGYDSAVDGRNSEMVFTVHAMLAAHKSREMSQSIRRGLRQSARRGRHIGNIAPFGYRKAADGTLLPDPQFAPVVRDIFTMYLSGLGAKAIADALNARRIPTASALRSKRSTSWQASTVNAMLHNQAYTGTIVAHKRTAMQDLEYSRRVDHPVKRLHLREEKEWVVVPGAHEPIVDRSAFAAVQRLLDLKARHKGVRRNANLLAGLLVCASCGSRMIVTGGAKKRSQHPYKYIVCSRVRRIGKAACDNHAVTPYGDLLGAVLEMLGRLALHDAETELSHALALSRTNGRTTAERRLTVMHAELNRIEEEQKHNLHAFHTGLFPTHIIEDAQHGLMARANALRGEIVRLRQEEEEKERLNRLLPLQSAWNIFGDGELYDGITRRMALQCLLDDIAIDRTGNIEVHLAWSE